MNRKRKEYPRDDAIFAAKPYSGRKKGCRICIESAARDGGHVSPEDGEALRLRRGDGCAPVQDSRRIRLCTVQKAFVRTAPQSSGER